MLPTPAKLTKLNQSNLKKQHGRKIMNPFKKLRLGSRFAIAVIAFSLGCDSQEKPLASSEANALGKGIRESASDTGKSEHATEHGHAPGQHGGVMVSLGRDSYHVEAVIDASGTIRLYTLGKDESRVIDVEATPWKGFVKAQGDAEAVAVAFEPQPQEGDLQNKSSLFVGKIPQELSGRALDVTIPNININGERFRLGFQSAHSSSDSAHGMPDQLAKDEESELYLKPMGRYTASDIEANEHMLPSQKFKGLKSMHNMNPKVGDQICPITETKANPKFSWIVDGESYLFCCPPCVDEFVKMAKSSSEPLPAPESYVKK